MIQLIPCFVLAASALPQDAPAVAPRPPVTLQLPAVLSSGMVLQRDATVPLWGRDMPGTAVSVSTTWSDAAWTTVTDSEGRWRADITTGPAGGPHAVTVRGSRQVVLENVLLGEVWLCSGQSNMEWPLGRILDAYRASPAFDEARAARTRADLRLFDVTNRISMTPLEDCDGAWRACTPESSESFSAVGYFFGAALADALGVPVGLVGANWGGTPVRAWTSREVISQFTDYAEALARIEALAGPDGEARRAEAAAKWWAGADAATPESASWSAPGLDDSEWTAVTVPGLWESGPLGDVDGIVWFRREVDVPAAWAGQQLSLSLGPVDDDERTFWNGTPVGTTGGHREPRLYTIPGELVRAGRNVLAVQVHDSGGAGGFGGEEDDLSLAPLDAQGPARPLAGAWRARYASASPGGFPRGAAFGSGSPATLYNGMIAPLTPFRFSGAIWYQGESDRSRPLRYRATFPAMIVDWRNRFERSAAGDELPFFWAQIAPFSYGDSAHEVALLHEAQDRALTLPRTGQVLLTDVGNLRDIHPQDKWTVGARFARQALARVYGRDLDPDGPRYASHEVVGNEVWIRFDHAANGLVARGGPDLTWFHVAGVDRRFAPAEARIEGDEVVLTCELVPQPVAIRFGWSDIAEPNLFDADGLPAAPFRTDDWDDVAIEY